MKYLSDYKGKHFVLQDVLEEDDVPAFPMSTIRDEDITDEFLMQHIVSCTHYGIPAYLGNDVELKKRIEKIERLIQE